VCRYCGIVRH
jgi:hypothetical protein